MPGARRSCSPPSQFLDLAGEDIHSGGICSPNSAAHELCLRARPHHPGGPRLSPPRRRRGRRACYLVGAVSATVALASPRASANSSRPGSNPSAAPIPRRRTPRRYHSGWRPPPVRHRRSGDPHWRCLAVLRADRGAGTSRQHGSGASSRISTARRRSRTSSALPSRTVNGRPEAPGQVSRRMADANPKAAHALVTDLLSIAGISAVRVADRRDRRPFRRAGRARRFQRAAG